MHTLTNARQQRILNAGFAQYHSPLLRYAQSRLRDKATADDVVQNTFVKVSAYMRRGGTITVMEVFLYHILKALIIDEYRRRTTVSLERLYDQGFDIPSHEIERTIDTYDGAIAMRLLTRLSQRTERVIRLRYLSGLSIAEIAVRTGQTKNTVTVTCHRGLQKLKEWHEAHTEAATHG